MSNISIEFEDRLDFRWVTIRGRHVNINAKGTIIEGPDAGKTIADVVDALSKASETKPTTKKKVASKVIAEKPQEQILAIDKISAKYEGEISLKRMSDQHLDLSGNIAGFPAKFNKYTLSNGTEIFVDSDIKDHAAKVKIFADSLSYVPKEHSGYIKTVTISNKSMTLPFNAGVDANIFALAKYKKGHITTFNDSLDDKRIKGIITHEIGHLIPPNTRKSFELALDKDKRDVTLYGTRKNKEEAFAEAYSKYFISGKVTGIGGKSTLTNANTWLKENYGKTNGKESNNSDLLYLSEDDKLEIEPIIENGKFVGEIVRIKRNKKTINVEIE